MEVSTKTKKPKIRLQITKGYQFVNGIVQKNKLNTVCEEEAPKAEAKKEEAPKAEAG